MHPTLLRGISPRNVNTTLVSCGSKVTKHHSVEVERRLRTAEQWHVAQRFFPVSAAGWQLFATERPNHWSANFRGYYFHIAIRIGSSCTFCLPVIEHKIDSYEALRLPPKHFIRLRSVYYDDKHGTYTWYLDYMHPHKETPAMNAQGVARALGEEQMPDHCHDVEVKGYSEFSDHYDADHYDFYVKNMGNFILGLPRAKS